MNKIRTLGEYLRHNRNRLVAITLVWTMALILGLVLFYFATPPLEARFYPVLTKQRIENVERFPGRVCWRWVWNKVRFAHPSVVSWSLVVNGTAVEYQILPRRKRDGEVVRDIKPAPLGPGSNEFCASIAATLDTIPDLTIQGQAGYVVPHGLWTIWQEVPPVPVPTVIQNP